MHHKLHYIGWTRSLVSSVSEFLLADGEGVPLSLRDTLVVVPTAQSGRRLRRALARRAEQLGTGVLTGAVITPFRLLNERLAEEDVDRMAEMAAWLDVLTPVRCRQFRALFPRLPKVLDFKWRRDAASTLVQTLAQLAEAELTAADVASSPLINEAESKRWRDIEALSGLVRDKLAMFGLKELTGMQIKAARTSDPPSGLRRVVVAACPELAPLIRTLLERWAEKIQIDVLVHAPPALADAFDAWGCPSAEYWRSRAIIELEECGTSLLAVGSPKEQALAMKSVMELHHEWSNRGGFSVGVPDVSVTPYVVNLLRDMGCPCFDPAGTPYRLHPVYQWLKAWRDLAVNRTYENLRDYMRHAQALDQLERKHGLPCSGLLSELDALQNGCLPYSVEDVAEFVESRRDTFPNLAVFIPRLLTELDRADVLKPDAMVAQLIQLYDGQLLAPGNPVDDAFIAVARHLVEKWGEQEKYRRLFPEFKDAEWVDLILESAGTAFYYDEPRQAAVELEGWLELPWNESPLMIVTGMNDGFVPDAAFDGMLLPDSIREKLGLKSDCSRSARDAYILCALTEARRIDGHLALIAGRTSDRGDVLKPSRLFWRCRDDVLLKRADAFFKASPVHQPIPEKTFNVSLSLNPPDERARQRVAGRVWNVTDFAAYLTCPLRFYLGRKLEMEPVNDNAEELDAMEFGKLIHGALEWFGKDRTLWSSNDSDVIAGALADSVNRSVLQLYGRRPPVTVDLQVQSAIQRLRAFASMHVLDFQSGWEIVDVEKRLVINIGDVEIRGVIDRVDRHPDGRIRLVDYKTYDKVKTPEMVHFRPPRANDQRDYVAVSVTTRDRKGTTKSRDRHWADLQLPLYRHYMVEALGRDAPISAGYVLLTKAVSDVSLQMWDDLDEKLTGSALACARGIIADASRNIYWPPLVSFAHDQYDECWWPGFSDQMVPLTSRTEI